MKLSKETKAQLDVIDQEWDELANKKENTAFDHVVYVIRKAAIVVESGAVSVDQAKEWCNRKLSAAFTPSRKAGRQTLVRWLKPFIYSETNQTNVELGKNSLEYFTNNA